MLAEEYIIKDYRFCISKGLEVRRQKEVESSEQQSSLVEWMNVTERGYEKDFVIWQVKQPQMW